MSITKVTDAMRNVTEVDAAKITTGTLPAGRYTNTTYSVQDGELSENNFTDADHTKLDGIETNATADQTKTDIEALGIDVPAANLTGSIANARIPESAVTQHVTDPITKSTDEPEADTNPSGGVGTLWLRTTTGEMYCCTDATTDDNVWTNIGDGTGAQPIVYATGGTESTYSSGGNDYQSHTFTSSGTFAVSVGRSVDVLIVGGGGAGGNWHAGGGGAGGMQVASTSVTAQNYSIVIGAGGAGGTTSVGSNGANSSGIGTTSLGGGRGGNYRTTSPASGGSGAGGNGTASGGNYTQHIAGAAGTSGQGNAGGDGSGNHAGGGGGGKGAVGADGQGTYGHTAGNGGAGGTNDYKTGSNITYAGGGGGGVWSGTRGSGGSGGGGGGGHQNTIVAPSAGTANTGGGGGGNGGQGNATSYAAQTTGGSGIVVIRYQR